MNVTGPDEHETYAEWDGAYVVGALSPADRQDYERHLAVCERCRAAVADLASLPGLLARIDPADAAGLLEETSPNLTAELAAPPADFEQRLLAAAGRRARPSLWRRTSTRVGVGVAAAAAAAAAVVVPLTVTGSDQPAAAVSVALRPRAQSPLSADVALVPTAWGTKVDMTCRYAKEPYAARHSYALYVVDGSGEESLVARWHARPGQTATTSGATDLALDDIRQVQLRDGANGTVLLAGRPRAATGS